MPLNPIAQAMLAHMNAHVDELAGFFDGPESGFHYGSGTAYKSDDRTIGSFAGIYVQQPNARYHPYLVRDLANDIQILSFAEIRYTFDDLLHMRAI